MSEPFIGEIRIFAYSFAPRGWAYCDGETIPIAGNEALFAILGTIWGGNGRTDFCLPDLRGRAPMHGGTGSGLTKRSLSEVGGSEGVSLDSSMLPAHSHCVQASTAVGDQVEPIGNYFSNIPTVLEYKTIPYSQTTMSEEMVSLSGEGDKHLNLQPYLTLPFFIAMEGLFPQRN